MLLKRNGALMLAYTCLYLRQSTALPLLLLDQFPEDFLDTSMGNSQSFHNTIPVPQNPPLAIIEQRFCLPNPVTLRLRNKLFSFSQDSDIRDPFTGILYFRVKGRVFSMKDKKTLLDFADVPVLNLQEPMFRWRKTYEISRGNDQVNRVMDVTLKFTFLKTKMGAVAVNISTGQQVALGVLGNWSSRNAIIWVDIGNTGDKESRIPIAKIYRPLNIQEMIFGAESYYIEIAPGVDIALIVALCVCVDDHLDEQQNNH